MIDMALKILAICALFAGTSFALIGAVGLLRFPDLYTRMHAASKAGTLGSGFCLLAIALLAPSFDVSTRAIAAIVFFLLTAPISAHLLARAAIKSGYRPKTGSSATVSASQKNETSSNHND